MTKTLEKTSKKEVWKMFDLISSTYDKTNHWMTFGLDKLWRGKLSDFLPATPNIKLLDCATGTADQILTLICKNTSIQEAIGIDLSEKMLEIGQSKIKKSPHSEKIKLMKASALELPFEKDTFDCITMSFGIRNVTDRQLCFREMLRVLKKRGRTLILETSTPTLPVIKQGHRFYLKHVLPRIGGWISEEKGAYEYLHKTAEEFPSGDDFCKEMKAAGFSQVTSYPLALGAVSIYVGEK